MVLGQFISKIIILIFNANTIFMSQTIKYLLVICCQTIVMSIDPIFIFI